MKFLMVVYIWYFSVIYIYVNFWFCSKKINYRFWKRLFSVFREYRSEIENGLKTP